MTKMHVTLVVVNVIIFLLFCSAFNILARKHLKFPYRVLIALLVGIGLGALMQALYGHGSAITRDTAVWIDIVGDGYVALLKMISIPLIVVSISMAIINMNTDKSAGSASVGKTSGQILFVLLATTGIAAVIGILAARIFGLEAPNIQNDAVSARASRLVALSGEAKSIPAQILDMFPANPFYDLTGARSSSTVGVVIVSALFAVATRYLAVKKPQSFEIIKRGVTAAHDVVMRVVAMILRLTPYGVLALILNMVAGSAWSDILNLGWFVLASYAAIIAMFVIHLIIVAGSGLNPIGFVKKIWPALTFGFVSRSSAATLPLTIKTQVSRLGVDEGVANLSGSLGVSIGQNGCAAIYPAMVVMMILQQQGEPITIAILIKLVLVIIIGSFGVAGVGGGATFATIIVCSLMNLPIALVGVLISVEPLIDMGRTGLNISDAILTGVVVSKRQKNLNLTVYNDPRAAAMED